MVTILEEIYQKFCLRIWWLKLVDIKIKIHSEIVAISVTGLGFDNFVYLTLQHSCKQLKLI